ncbi:hypothetical protein GCM10010156_65900 [Planobispora rosea]|uniref:Uncharacterized protein n=1 Tax=Planobispora rosea TaxID=35762 RepID=A0A8J3SA81_PLARO|nr:hypothetical protein [Planobispora rosea]GGS98590.1 hypothetical protein GCM10010156_65900 [Planobispora rosea]GIH87954.1 hypothetical protein Pro02_63620 [Planobispora rosea]
MIPLPDQRLGEVIVDPNLPEADQQVLRAAPLNLLIPPDRIPPPALERMMTAYPRCST